MTARSPFARRSPAVLASPDALWAESDEARRPLILALDTSSKVGGVALARGAEILVEETWCAGGSQTSQVLPVAAGVCKRAGISIQDLGLVVVASGPGSFTGLRVGMSLGKGLAAARGVALVGVATLDAVAHQFRHAAGTILALVDAGREQVYAGTYRSTARGLVRQGQFQTFSEDELLAHAESLGKVLVCGEQWPERARRLAALPNVSVASPAATLRRPAFLAELGYLHWLAAGPGDPAALQPIYLKRT